MLTLVDTGPLVALLKADEQHHRWVAATFRRLPAAGMATCESVLSEACLLLARWPAAVEALFQRINDGSLRLESMVGEYSSVPASYADACLIRLSERYPDATLITTDSDFDSYRRNGRQLIPRLAPFG